MRRIKGQNALLPVIVITVISTSGFLAILNTEDVISQSIEYNTGDYNTISETKLRADAYENRTRKELNYSTNIVALKNGSHGGDVNWEYNIPNYEDDLKPTFLNNIRDHLSTQNTVRSCSSPTIEDVRLFDSNISRFETEISDAYIQCDDQTTEGDTKVETTVNISDIYRVINPKNRYLRLAEYSEVFANNAQENISEKEADNSEELGYWEAEGEASKCEYEDPEPDEDARDDAEEEAKEEAKDNLPNPSVAENAYDPVDKPNYFEAVSLNTEYIKDAEVTDVDSETEGCWDSDDDEWLTEYDVNATATIEELKVKFEYQDGERTVINSEGEFENIVFDFTYRVRP